MNTAITAIEEDINGAGPCNVVFRARKRMGVGHDEFCSTRRRDHGDRVGGGVTWGDLIAAATSPVLYPIGTAMKATGTLAAMVRVRLDGVAVVAAGA
jgi:hypothetical protein